MADPTPTPDPAPTPDPDPAPEPDPVDWKAMARKHEADAKKAKADLARHQAANQSEAEKAIAAAKAEGRTEALTVANERILRSEVRAIAGTRLADPGDAVNLLDLTQFAVGDDGEVDRKAIGAAIDELVNTKPYLAAGGPSVPSVPRGSRGSGGNTGDMNAVLLRQLRG